MSHSTEPSAAAASPATTGVPRRLRAWMLSGAWCIAGLMCYGLLVLLELYWNAYEWQPAWDLIGLGILLGLGFVLGVLGGLAWWSREGLSRGVSLAICLGFLILAIYLLPSEPLTEGLFGRETPSPTWYRVGRSMVLGLPSVFWVLARRWRSRNHTPCCP